MRRKWWVREPKNLDASKSIQQAGLKALLSDENAETAPEVRRFTHAWLRSYPDTRPTNIAARLNARSKRRAKSKVARASRKANR
jgi:hypothetical protein